MGDVEAGRINAGDTGRQGIGAHEVATQGLLQHGDLGRVRAEHAEHVPEAVIGDIFTANRPAGHGRPFTYRVFSTPLSAAVEERQHARSVCQDFLARVRE
jgi:hypothetical protein